MTNNLKLFLIFIGGLCLGFLLIGGSSTNHKARLIDQMKISLAQNAQELKKANLDLDLLRKKTLSQNTQIVELKNKIIILNKKLEELTQNAQKAEIPAEEDFNKVYQVPVGSSKVKGNVAAKVTIAMFADFQCPYCAKFYTPIDDVLKAYGGKVNFVVKNFPLSSHVNAMPAAKLALAAGEQGKYFEMIRLLLDNKADVGDAKIKEYAKKLKINYRKLIDAYKNKNEQWEKIIKEEVLLGKEVDVRGTPTFYINGKKTRARDLEGFKAEIDPLL